MLQTISLSIIFILYSFIGYSQDTTKKKDKQVISRYSGGELGLDELQLTLYSDSSYLYSCWNDDGQSWSFENMFRRTDSTIVLYSKDTILNNGHKTGKVINDSSVYRAKNNTILFYSKEDEKKYPEISEFRTLYLDKNDK